MATATDSPGILRCAIRPVTSRSFFRNLIDKLAGRCNVLTLRHQGRVVSGAFLAWHHGVLYVPFASSRPSVVSLRANNLLWWEIMRVGLELGLHTLDFGTCPQGSSGLEFKLKWGGRAEPVSAALYSRSGKVPALATSESRGAQLVMKIWASLPRGVVESLGPTICSWIA